MIEQLSGAGGELASFAAGCRSCVATLVKGQDEAYGANATDAYQASCSTCKHFSRHSFDRKEHNPNLFGFPGDCLLKQIRVVGEPRLGLLCPQNKDCYVNRRTGLMNHEWDMEATGRVTHAD